MYNFRSLSNKIPSTLPRRFFSDFIYVFDPVLFVQFCFRGLIRKDRKKSIRRKEYFHFGHHCPFFLRYKLNLVVTALQLSRDSFGTN